MVREDYIMRMVTQFVRIILHILDLYRTNRSDLARIAIDHALRDLLGIGADSVARLTDSQLLALIKFGEQTSLWREKGAFLAALLKIEGAIAAQEEQPDVSAQRYLQALQIMLETLLDTDTQELPTFAPTVEELVELLHETHLPAKTNAALLRYYEQIGAYSKVEDALFEWRHADPDLPDVTAYAIAFYERLLQRSDTALIAGNLPRDEVVAGLREWRDTLPETDT